MKPVSLCYGVLSVAPLLANELITPSSLTTNGVSEFFPAENIINDSGLSATPDISNYETVEHVAASATTAWTTNNPNGAGDYYLAGAEGQLPVFTFTLSELSTLSALVFWGYHFDTPNGNETREFVVEFSRDGGNNYPDSVTVSVELSDFAFNSVKTLPFEEEYAADVIRIRLTDNHFGGTAAGGDRMGLGEIKFIGTPGGGENLAITGFEIESDQMLVTSVSGLRPGTTYHLESGSNLQDFAPVPESEFTSESPEFPSAPATGPVRFLRLVEGPVPGP